VTVCVYIYLYLWTYTSHCAHVLLLLILYCFVLVVYQDGPSIKHRKELKIGFMFCQALDFVISEAQKNGIRLILSLSNNWDAFGGKSQYLKWGNSAGLDLSSEDAFFSHATLKAYFKNHIKV
jgi:endo-1,4-beta-mannosidase